MSRQILRKLANFANFNDTPDGYAPTQVSEAPVQPVQITNVALTDPIFAYSNGLNPAGVPVEFTMFYSDGRTQSGLAPDRIWKVFLAGARGDDGLALLDAGFEIRPYINDQGTTSVGNWTFYGFERPPGATGAGINGFLYSVPTLIDTVFPYGARVRFQEGAGVVNSGYTFGAIGYLRGSNFCP